MFRGLQYMFDTVRLGRQLRSGRGCAELALDVTYLFVISTIAMVVQPYNLDIGESDNIDNVIPWRAHSFRP
jgi:hypothetical protein